MLTNEQCIKVAELWGYKVEKGSPEWGSQWLFFTKGSKDDLAHSEWITLDLLQHEIRSWQGFGKTVEAMAEYHPKTPLQYNSRVIIANQIETYMHRNTARYMSGGNDALMKLFETVHMAALEAIKE